MAPRVQSTDAPSAEASREERFQRIYASEVRYVWSSLLRLGVPARDLEDVTHETLLTVYKKLDEYDEQRPLRPWLFGFAYRMAADYRKRAHLRYEVGPDSDFELRSDERPTAEDEIAKRQARELVVKALEALSLENAAVFVMMEIDGHSAPEAADALDVPLNTVYSRLRVARQDFTAAVRRLAARRGTP